MKKFLIFLVAIVVVVCFGLTIFYFVRNDEVINFTTKEIYCNVGDIITRDELGLKVKKRNRKTTYNYNANTEVLDVVKYDNEHNYYVVNEEVGGDYTVTISTSNKKCPKFEIVFHIGDGLNNPYNISDAEDLQNIGTRYDATREFIVRNDIRLTDAFTPIANFNGTINGNGHTIYNLTVNADAPYAGLFGKVKNASIQNLRFENVAISGAFNFAGALAGSIENSAVSCVTVNGGFINSTSANAVVGGLAGEIVSTGNVKSNITSISAENLTLTGDNTVGGLIGKLDSTTIQATFAKATIGVNTETVASKKIGGLIGEFVIAANAGSIQQSYAVATSDYANFGSFIGTIRKTTTFAEGLENDLSYLIGNYTVGEGNEIAENTTGMFDILFDESRNEYKITADTAESALADREEYVFFAVSGVKTLWDDNAWDTTNIHALPKLKMAKDVIGVTQGYLNRTPGKNVGSTEKSEEENRKSLQDTLSNPITENVTLLSNYTYDMNGVTVNPQDIKDIMFVGENTVIDGLTIDGSLFNTVDGCTIKDITFTNLKFKDGANAQGLFGTVLSNGISASTISNIKVSYASEIANVQGYFGGIANRIKDGTIIENCAVENLKVNANKTAKIAGLVGYVENGFVRNNKVDATLAGAVSISGLTIINKGVVANNSGKIVVANTEGCMFATGLVAENYGTIRSNNLDVTINVTKSIINMAYVSGMVYNNYVGATLENNTITGKGIVFAELTDANKLFVAGDAIYNFGKILNDNVNVEQIGNFAINADTTIAGKDYYVAGLTYYNDGTIYQSVVTSSIAGNTVAGAIIKAVNNSSAEQIFVGKDLATRNQITGDKYVAGVAYALSEYATIANVQTKSTIVGVNENTIASLVVLHFPNGTTFKNAVIDNAATGMGTIYTETWTDYNGSTDNYNLFGDASKAGTFTGVVINTSEIDNKLNAKHSFFNWTNIVFFAKNNYNGTNFFAYVTAEQLKQTTTFTGNCVVRADETNSSIDGKNDSKRWGINSKRDYSFDWDFNSSVWANENGANLSFLNDVFAD